MPEHNITSSCHHHRYPSSTKYSPKSAHYRNPNQRHDNQRPPPNPHLLRPRGVVSENGIEALKHTLAPLQPDCEIEPIVFVAAQDDDPLKSIIAQTLESFYEDIVEHAAMTTDAVTGFFEAMTGESRLDMESTVVQNGVNVPSTFLSWKLVQSFGMRLLEWTESKNLYGSKDFPLRLFPP